MTYRAISSSENKLPSLNRMTDSETQHQSSAKLYPQSKTDSKAEIAPNIQKRIQYDFELIFCEIRNNIKTVPIILPKPNIQENLIMEKQAPKGYLQEKLPPAHPATAHKRYSSVYPVANTLLAKRWDDASLKRHRDKIRSMKACIDNENHLMFSPSRQLKKTISKEGIY